MLEFIKVDHPAFWPNCCVACHSQTGPVADTHMEPPGWGRVYVCESCARRLARLFGYAKGKRMDELSEAAGALETRDGEITQLVARIGVLEAEGALLEKQTNRLADEMIGRDQRIKQLEGKLRDNAESTLAVVGDAT